MAVVTSGNIVQSGDGTVLTFTDTTTGLGTVTSRVLVINDPNGVQLASITMGAAVVATFAITADGWFRFIETIIDNTGTYTATVDYLSTTFYELAFSPLANKLDCCTCEENCLNLYKGEICKDNALFLFQRGQGVLAQSAIQAANTYISEVDCGC